MVVGLGQLGVRRSSTRWAMLECCPIQVGVVSTRMSASITCAGMLGQASPPPCRVPPPGARPWSTTRTSAVCTSYVASAASTCSAISWLLDGAGCKALIGFLEPDRRVFTLRLGQVATEYFDKYLFEFDPALLSQVAEAMVALGSVRARASVLPRG